MKANEFLKVVAEIIRPTCKLTPVTLVDNFEAERRGIKVKHKYDILYNFTTGEIEYKCGIYNPNNGFAFIEMFDAMNKSISRYSESIYFEYLPKYNATAICLLGFNCSNYEIGEKRNFEVIDYYFITEDKYFVYKKDEEWIAENNKFKLCSELPFSYCLTPVSDYNLMVEIARQCGIIKVDTKYELICKPTQLTKYMLGKIQLPKEYKVSNRLKLTSDKILEVDLPQIVVKGENKYANRNYAKLEYVNSDISVIRWFVYVDESLYLEYMRYYVTDSSKFLCILENDGQFHVCNKNIKEEQMLVDCMFYDKEELKDSKFRYFFDLIDDSVSSEKVINLYNLIRFGLLEKLGKTNFNYFVEHVLTEYHLHEILPYTTIKNVFSTKFSVNETDIYKALGVNKYQYRKIAQAFSEFTKFQATILQNTMASIRILFKGNQYASISDIDNDSFDKFFDILIKVNRSILNNSIPDLVSEAVKFYSYDAIYNALNTLFVLYDKQPFTRKDARTMLMDYIHMAGKLNDTKSFPLKFKHFEDVEALETELENAHNAIMEVYNLMTEETKTKEFYTQIKKCKKWEYRTKTFTVVSPVHPNEIAKEGITLHHCVKSYIDKVADGSTNIMFLRKTDDIENPFFTVEVSNLGELEQVHGFGNRNTDTEPGLDNFITQWAKDKKITITNFNKIR